MDGGHQVAASVARLFGDDLIHTGTPIGGTILREIIEDRRHLIFVETDDRFLVNPKRRKGDGWVDALEMPHRVVALVTDQRIDKDGLKRGSSLLEQFLKW